MKKPLKLGFVDFYHNWGVWPNPVEYFTGVLSKNYDVEVVVSDFIGHRFDTGKKPDLVICTIPSEKYLQYDCKRILFPAELAHPHYDGYDACMTWDFDDDPRHYRLPNTVLYGDFDKLTQPKPAFDELWNRQFCCVLFGRGYPHEQTPREWFFQKLCEYKKVDSAGHFLNNTGLDIPDAFGSIHRAQSGPHKIEYMRKYKFALCFENAQWPGYTSEKLTDAMFANCLPIYWGNPVIGRDFNTKSMLNCSEYENFDKVIQRIVELDTNESAYREVIEQPYFTDNVVSPFADKDKLLQFFNKVINA
jgi:hypothetical protein